MTICVHCGADVGEARYCPFDGTPLAHIGAPVAARLPDPGALLDGRYRIRAELGRGGVGVVYAAHAEALSREVALKVLMPHSAAEKATVGRFAREARATSRIDHANVVRVYEFGYAREGHYYLAMELLSGQPLSRLLRSTRLGTRRALPLLEQIAAGLAAAHAHGVVHRDIKPENVMIDQRDGEHVTLVDFGLCKPSAESSAALLTREGDLLGTPDYMAPEQWLGKPADLRVDVYAFGVLAYEVLAGALPLPGDTLPEVMRRHLQERPVPLAQREANEPIPRALCDLVDRCLSKAPEARPADMGEVYRGLSDSARGASDPGSFDERSTDGADPEVPSGLGVDGLLAEIAHLAEVRRRRLPPVLGGIFVAAPPEPVRRLLAKIEEGEAQADAERTQLVRARDALEAARASRRGHEAQLRSELAQASLVVAARRSALPPDLALELELGLELPVEPVTPPPDDFEEAEVTVVDVIDDVRAAEMKLADFLDHDGQALDSALRHHATTRNALDATLCALDEAYAQLTEQLDAAPGLPPNPTQALRGVTAAIRLTRAELSRRSAA